MNSNFNISVIIPTFNRRHTLERAITSVLNQTFKPVEIIVVDDGSTDGTDEWLQLHYPSIKLFCQSNCGVSSARNLGIQHAQTDWISLLDSDDEWLAKKLEKQTEILKKNSNILFCHTNEIWVRNGVRVNQGKKHQKYGGMIFENCLDMCRISPSSSLFHRSLLDDVGIFDEDLKVCEDYDLWLRITAKYPVLYLDEPLIKKYGGHDDQLSLVSEGIEKYRIQTLEKLRQDKKLELNQKYLVERMLVRKYTIYANGVLKRGRKTEHGKLMNKIRELEISMEAMQEF